jgi:hypothetical protein
MDGMPVLLGTEKSIHVVLTSIRSGWDTRDVTVYDTNPLKIL